MPRNPTKVKLVSGKTFDVITRLEADWFNETRDAYRDQTKFTEITDLRDLDRLLIFELHIFRWTQWLAAGEDYEGDLVDESEIRKNLREFSAEVTKIKDSMGLNKKARDSAAAEGNFAAWIADLKHRAKQFGIHREHQLTRTLTLWNELASIVRSYDRSDEEERRKNGFETEAEIVDWLRNVALPEYDAIDEHFRANTQKYWIRDQ